MVAINKRVKIPQAMVINGVDAGGKMSIVITEGYDEVPKSAPDGAAVPVADRGAQFCRGTGVTQDWIHIIELLTGTVGTYAFSEKKSGAETYLDHVINNPVVYNVRIAQAKGGYITCTYDFECRAADETKGFADMHTVTDAQEAPTFVTAARGGWRVKTAAHGAISVYHVTTFNFGITMRLDKACNDGDVGYTCVDAEQVGMACGGALGFEDSEVDGGSSELKSQQLLGADAGNLVITVVQSGGAADKVITIARTIFTNVNRSSDVNAPFTGHTGNFVLTDNPAAPLSLAGDNKIITIEDAV